MVLVYSPKQSPRLYYTVNLLLHELLELEYNITSDQNAFVNYDGPKINYGSRQFSDEIHLPPHPLLFESEVHQQRIESAEYKGINVIFSTPRGSALPYDPFAAAFYLVSRYEEYLPFRGDQYGRFRGEKSTAYAKNFLHLPVVNHYAIHLRELLEARYPRLVFHAKSYQFVLTYDVDIAYSILDKGFLRDTVAVSKALLQGDKNFLKLRKNVLAGLENDPYDTFEEQFRLHEKHRVYPIYFFHVGDHGAVDKSTPWTSPRVQALIKQISSKYLHGLHPSYASNEKYGTLEMEMDRLNSITGKATVRSRQHYLAMKFPETYRRLNEIGIQEDYTMGYQNLLGFRAGICSPFNFYDIERDEQTALRVFPFAAMDSTLHHQMGLKAEAALEEVKTIADEVRRVQGLFVFVAHNNLIGAASPFKGWRHSFDELIRYVKD
ncbi:MAG TPA: polysaccharide deacetylase family protein [Chitinophagales bacterium]|nr:polysaccharide deacetylase family protein [Chitinophagales bacterium]